MKRVLSFLSLLDADGNLSITNLAMYVALAKMAFASQLGGSDVVAMLGAFGNYIHKRHLNGDTPSA